MGIKTIAMRNLLLQQCNGRNLIWPTTGFLKAQGQFRFITDFPVSSVG
jgi:hypothetical protein